LDTQKGALEEEAKGRQGHGKTSPGSTLREKIPYASKASEKAADAFGTNPRSVSAAPSQTAMAAPSCAGNRSRMLYLTPDELTPAAECTFVHRLLEDGDDPNAWTVP